MVNYNDLDSIDRIVKALQRFAVDDPWEFVEITTHFSQPPDQCFYCKEDKPRLLKDRTFAAHDKDCAWVEARIALGLTTYAE